jgi:hypothetical protein
MKQSLRSLLLVASLTAPSFAATGVIGVASAIGSFSLNNTSVTGTANVADGASLVTSSTTSQVYLQNGSTVSLGTSSSAKVYSNKLVLQSGVARIDNLDSSFDLQASGYRIEGSGKGTRVVARLSGDQLQVASIAGSFKVYGSNGVLLRTVGAGNGTTLDGQSGATDQGSGTTPPSGGAKPASSGATGAGALTDAQALLIVGGLAAVGIGLGAYYGSQGGGTPTVISPL